mmetsp:Transcript_29668/g.114233  ORF Transcript_29668/g.114233 Transcript_29668/m.114233 type:complete len:81 (-) Transcript_29668:2358-2600(-)
MILTQLSIPTPFVSFASSVDFVRPSAARSVPRRGTVQKPVKHLTGVLATKGTVGAWKTDEVRKAEHDGGLRRAFSSWRTR